MPQSTRNGYVMGLSDGPWFSTGVCFKAASASANRTYGNSQFGEIVQGVDDFYREPANLLIEVPADIQYFQMMVNGTNAASLAEELALERRIAAEALAAKKEQ
jgi:hypothetical protein